MVLAYLTASDKKSEAFFMLIFLLLLQKRGNNDHLFIREHSRRNPALNKIWRQSRWL